MEFRDIILLAHAEGTHPIRSSHWAAHSYRIRVDACHVLFELLTSEPGVKVSRIRFVVANADEKGISAVTALLVSKKIKVYEFKPGPGFWRGIPSSD